MATDHERRLAELLKPSSHFEGCKGEDVPEDVRLEAFETELVVKAHIADDEGGRDVVTGRQPWSIVRCQDCGAQVQHERPLADLLAEAGERL